MRMVDNIFTLPGTENILLTLSVTLNFISVRKIITQENKRDSTNTHTMIITHSNKSIHCFLCYSNPMNFPSIIIA